jgi:EAL domain-containing protein (putative c-di-GMP-specific phosphodiesterase class I)
MEVPYSVRCLSFSRADVPTEILHGRDGKPVMTHNLQDASELCERMRALHETAMHQGEQTVLTLGRLKAPGIALSIDDFGTGYSNPAYLKRFAVQKRKIDRSLVNDHTRNSDDQAIVTAVIVLANSLGLVVVAEGVESRSQLASLKRLCCRHVQGYHFSRPVPADEAADLPRGGLPPAGAG